MRRQAPAQKTRPNIIQVTHAIFTTGFLAIGGVGRQHFATWIRGFSEYTCFVMCEETMAMGE